MSLGSLHSDPTVILSAMTYIQRRILCLGLGDQFGANFHGAGARNGLLPISEMVSSPFQASQLPYIVSIVVRVR